MNDCGGFGLIGFLLLFLFGAVIGMHPLMSAIILGTTYYSVTVIGSS